MNSKNKYSLKIDLSKIPSDIIPYISAHLTDCEAGENMPLHRAIKDHGIENFSFEVIKTVEFIDDQHLLIIESCYMDNYDSICNGYNTKHSVPMFDLC